MNLKLLKDDELHLQISLKAKEERRITLELLHYLREVEARRLFAKRGFASLHDYAVKHLGYSDGSAARRINSMRLLKDVPEMESKIMQGKLNLTALSKVQTVLKAHEKISGVKVGQFEKEQVLQKIEQKSFEETQRLLFQTFPDAAKSVENTRRVVIDDQTIRLSLNLSVEAMAMLEKAKALMSHAVPDGDLSKVIEKLAQEFVKKKDLSAAPVRSTGGAKPDTCRDYAADSIVEKHRVEKRGPCRGTYPKARAYISMKLKKEVWRKDEGRCTYVDPVTKRKCEAKHFLEIDHIKPIAIGGGNEPENLRLLCRTHNQLRNSNYLEQSKFLDHRRQ